MNQREAVVEAMRLNGGVATLGQLYRDVFKFEEVVWKTKTPFKSINRIVQDPKYFYKIRPGLWALLDAKAQLSKDESLVVRPESDHTFYQGLLVEIGNLQKLATFVPRQDSKRIYLGRPLDDLVSVKTIYEFTYAEIVRRASMVDVIWFDDRKFPIEFIEVENTTDMNGALLKFSEFEPFRAHYRIVAPAIRRKEFDARIGQRVFEPIRKYVIFNTYDQVSELHRKTNEFIMVKGLW